MIFFSQLFQQFTIQINISLKMLLAGGTYTTHAKKAQHIDRGLPVKILNMFESKWNDLTALFILRNCLSKRQRPLFGYPGIKIIIIVIDSEWIDQLDPGCGF